MKSRIADYIESLIYLLLLVVAFFTPLLFIDLTSDFYGIPKLIFLVSSTLTFYCLWVTSWLLKGKITIKRTPLDMPLFLLLLVVLVSTIFSSSRYISIFGAFPEVHGSAVSWVTYILLYFVAASNIKDKNLGKIFLQVLIGSASVLAIVSILSFFKIFLPFEMAKNINFTPTGSTFSTASLLLMLLPLTLVSTVKPNKFLLRPVAMFISLLYSVTIVFIGSTDLYIVFFVVFLISIYLVKDYLNGATFSMILTPFVLSVLTLMLLLIPFSGNRFNENKFNFPKELQLPLGLSWKISISTFADAPILGTGPSTFIYNFTKYKPLEFNEFDFWNFKFGSSGNELFQALGVWGIAGLLALFFFYFTIFIQSKRYLISKYNKADNEEIGVFLPSLAMAGMVATAIIFIHSSTLITVVYTLFLMAIYFYYQRLAEEKENEFSISVRIPQKANKSFDLLPPVIFIVTLATVFFVGKKVYRAVVADYYHRLALVQAEKDGSKTYEYLQKAEELNPYIDLYHVDMAQTNLALANALAEQSEFVNQKTEGGALTNEEIQTIQTLIVQAINEAKAATVLAPRSSRNWEVLALIYRNISGVAKNSLTFALDAYGRAIENDPFNPALRLGVGMVYYSAGNFDQAIKFFTDSINLKPDYVKAYYNMALAFKDKGDLENAKIVAEQVVNLIKDKLTRQEQEKATELLREAWVRDYSTATKLLDQIKDKIDIGEFSKVEELDNSNINNLNLEDLGDLPQNENPDNIKEEKDLNVEELDLLDILTPTPF